MLARSLHYAAVVLSLVVIAGFGLWAVNEMGDASTTQIDKVAQINQEDFVPTGERAREQANGKAHEWIDDANDVLLKPFDSVVDSTDKWVTHGVPALLALLLYGFGLAFLGRYARGWGSAHGVTLHHRHDHA